MSWENKVGELSREEGRGVLFNKLMLFRDLFKAGVKERGAGGQNGAFNV